FSVDMKDDHVQKYVAAFKAKYGQNPDALASLGYDAGSILIDAMKRAKKLDGPSIRDALAETKDFPGVTGKITIDANRNARKSALVFKIHGKEYKEYKSYTPEQIGK